MWYGKEDQSHVWHGEEKLMYEDHMYGMGKRITVMEWGRGTHEDHMYGMGKRNTCGMGKRIHV